MYVKIMMWFYTILLSFFGITPAWCDVCGEMYSIDQMNENNVCPVCVSEGWASGHYEG